jgi:hypothetical protein
LTAPARNADAVGSIAADPLPDPSAAAAATSVTAASLAEMPVRTLSIVDVAACGQLLRASGLGLRCSRTRMSGVPLYRGPFGNHRALGMRASLRVR